jgi:biotin carboxylase
MSERTLLVLGASRYQLEVITKAKQLGYRVLTTDNLPHNPGHALADECFGVDTTDMEGVLDLARRAHVTGIVSPCTDVAVPTAAFVSEKLQLPGVPLSSARTLTSKILFRRWLLEQDMPVPGFRVLSAADTSGSEATDVHFPMVLKPDGSSGSKGIFIVRSREEVVARLPTTLAFSPVKRAVLEDFIEGTQGTCEGVVVDGKIVFSVLTDRDTAAPPYVATSGHFVPSSLAPAAQQATMSRVEAILAAHGVRTSPFDCDFVVTPAGVPYIIELTPRLGGNSLISLVLESTGVDLAEIAVRAACGDPVTLPAQPTARPTAQLILGAPGEGALTFDEAAFASLRREPWVRALSLDLAAGDRVERFTNGRHRIGEATLVGRSRADLDDMANELRLRLCIGAVA